MWEGIFWVPSRGHQGDLYGVSVGCGQCSVSSGTSWKCHHIRVKRPQCPRGRLLVELNQYASHFKQDTHWLSHPTMIPSMAFFQLQKEQCSTWCQTSKWNRAQGPIIEISRRKQLFLTTASFHCTRRVAQAQQDAMFPMWQPYPSLSFSGLTRDPWSTALLNFEGRSQPVVLKRLEWVLWPCYASHDNYLGGIAEDIKFFSNWYWNLIPIMWC